MDPIRDFVNAHKFAKEILFNFKNATKEKADLGESIYYILLISLIPTAIGSIFYGIFFSNLSSLTQSVPGSFSSVFALIMSIVYFFSGIIGIIAGALIYAGVIHIFGKLFRFFKKDFSKTLAAYSFGITPNMLVSWIGTTIFLFFGMDYSSLTGGNFLIYLPIIMGVSLIFGIWGFIILVYGLANQQEISKKKALLTIFTPVIIVVGAILWLSLGFITNLADLGWNPLSDIESIYYHFLHLI